MCEPLFGEMLCYLNNTIIISISRCKEKFNDPGAIAPAFTALA